MFENSKWLTFPLVEANMTRTAFKAERPVKKAVLHITALGYFEAFINGKRVSDDRLVPAMSEYEKRDLSDIAFPILHDLSYTVYYLDYDVTSCVETGENVLGVHIGSGWHGQFRSPNENMKRWGDNCLVFELELFYADGSSDTICSSPCNTVWDTGYITSCELYYGEVHDLTKYDSNWSCPGFDDSRWKKSEEREPIDAKILKTDFPTDKVLRSIVPEKIFSWGDITIYDLHETASGAGVIRFREENNRDNEVAIVRYADMLNDDMSLNFHNVGGTHRMQRDFFINSSNQPGHECYPHFTWHAGRYVEVCGNADLIRFDVVCSDIRKTAEFHCDNKLLQWIFDAWVLTEQANIHGCVPSDCPHRERLGYTGDGQLTSDVVMTVFDSAAMYRKWIRDIADGQDMKSGHVQYSAPFYGGGGGPGGWGGAMVIVPYNYYKHFGDVEIVREYIPNMKLYIGYLLSHSEDGLVVRGEDGGWCLGDWVPPYDDVTIPIPFVNTYFLAKCSSMLAELCNVVGDEEASEKYCVISENAGAALTAHYYDDNTGSFAGGEQGADAYALDIGIGDERTLKNLIEKYEALGTFDTGIFATDILIRILFEKGYPSLALSLLVNEKKETSFGWMMNSGATTLWENWNGIHSRVHPMYGAVCANYFHHILGISENGGEITVKPAYLPELGTYSGSQIIGGRKVSVKVSYEGGKQIVESYVE